MKKIWKYRIPIINGESCPVSLPKGACILHVGCQGSLIFIWAEVDPSIVGTEELYFEVFATGQPIPEDMGTSRAYINTVLLYNGGLAAHVYQRLS
mgnify:CR=1 FL=1|tara:strand:+ start:324 stop:608 length:285 start_codon:yes stop_codon:yes gene_type:complete